jgi:hypothetical protein
VAISLALIVLSPLLFAAGALAAILGDRKLRGLRIVAFFTVYLVYEVIGIAAMFALWIRSGAGLTMRSERTQNAHRRFMVWWLRGIKQAATGLFKLRIQVEDRPAPQPGPLLVFSRHAGPGNSLLLVSEIMLFYNRLPRIVMLAKLQWDPFFDMMGNRMPNRFIRHDPSRRSDYVNAIADLAGGTIRDDDAFVLFPEGRDFTPRLRLRAIAHLRKGGFHDAADRAELMARVMPPRPGGVAAAVKAAPHADVVFVAHTVLEDIGSFGDLWRKLPLDKPVLARYWRIPAEAVPSERAALIDWLFDWWATIDDWVAKRLQTTQPGLAKPAEMRDPTTP